MISVHDNNKQIDSEFARGYKFQKEKKYSDALASYRKVLSLLPDHYEALINSGNILRMSASPEDALPYYQKGIAVKSNAYEGYFNLGITLLDLARPDAAVKALNLALRYCPEPRNIYLLIGQAYRKLNRFDQARNAYQTLLAGNADDLDALMGLGYTCHETLALEEAESYYNKVLERDSDNADAHWNKATLLLLRGDFTNGWREAEWRKRLPRYPRFRYEQPEWNGADVKGKRILLESEQGYGDTIQFIRYTATLKERGAQVIVAASAALLQLLECVPGIDRLIHQNDARPECDAFTPLMSLPYLLHTDSDSIPSDIPYIHIDPLPDDTDFIAGNGSLRVGLSWAGNPLNSNDLKRSCPLRYFAELFGLPGIQFYSFQMGRQKRELEAYTQKDQIIDLSGRIANFHDTARLMQHMDLIISVDSAPAHLAGALGKPVWLTIPFFPDWRWLLGREDNPWYPTMRVFRQDRAGDWNTVMKRLKQELIHLHDRHADI